MKHLVMGRGGCGALLLVLIFIGRVGLSVYDLWRDWQNHRFLWWHLVLLLVSLGILVWFCITVQASAQRNRGGDELDDDESNGG